MVSKVRHRHRRPTMGQEDRGRHPSLGTLTPRAQNKSETIANNCKKLNITLSKKKFEIGRQIQFAGYLVGEDGLKPDPDRIRAITDFPQPMNHRSQIISLASPATLLFHSRFFPRHNSYQTTPRQREGLPMAPGAQPRVRTTEGNPHHQSAHPAFQPNQARDPTHRCIPSSRNAKRSMEPRQSSPVAPNPSHHPNNGTPP